MNIATAYYRLTKPGIIFGNAITAAGGFALASKGHLDFGLFLATLLGVSLIIASACVLNNCIDQKTDSKMVRTQNRTLVKELISMEQAMIFSFVLGLLGLSILTLYTGLLPVFFSMAGFFIYVVLYTIWKYRSTHGTLIGSFAGAAPAVVGYSAANPHLDTGALILFLMMILWQMPHFFAIALYRSDDYAAASIPVLPLIKGVLATKRQIFLYTLGFTAVSCMLTFFGYTGYVYLAVAILLGAVWLWFCWQGFKTDNDRLWARKIFLFSLVVITVLSGLIPLDVVR